MWKCVYYTTLSVVCSGLFGCYVSYLLFNNYHEITGSGLTGKEFLVQPASSSHRHCSIRFPSALIIGVRKGGTGTLLEFLGLHSRIKRTSRDEVSYFDKSFHMSEEWYLKKMPCSFEDEVVIEKSPSYFHQEKVPERVYRFNPNMKLLLIVRDPVTRIVSNFMHDKRKRNQIRKDKVRGANLKKMIEDSKTGLLNVNHEYVNISTYHEHLQNWYKWFPRHQILILDSQTFSEDPPKVLSEAEEFLGLPPELTNKMFHYNDKKGFYCYRTHGSDICMPNNKGTKHVEIDKNLNRTLINYFEPLNKQFFDLSNKTFEWYL